MAYAAVTSLKQTIHSLLSSSRISIDYSSREEFKSAYKNIISIQRFLKGLRYSWRSSSERLRALDGQTGEAARKLEDALEFRESNLLLSSEFESYVDEELSQEIYSFAETMEKIAKEYNKELNNPSSEEFDDAAVSSNYMDFGVKMVGFSEDFRIIKERVLTARRPDEFGLFAYIGMAGGGRTIAARAVFEDLYIAQEQYFDCGAWVTVGPKYQFKEILIRILAQVDDLSRDDHKLLTPEADEKNMAEYLYERLKGRRYMIVLDDVRDITVWDYLRNSFPKQDDGSLVLLTTELEEVALFSDCYSLKMGSAHDDDVIWDLLCRMMFDGEPCPPELEEAGMKIATNCQGNMIVLYKVITFLMNGDNTPEFWNSVAADEENPLFVVANEISEIYRLKDDLPWSNLLPDDDQTASTIKLASSYFLGLSNIIKDMKMWMFPERLFPRMQIVSLFGMAGIGKTTIAKEIFDHPSILCYFDYRAWITLGQEYQPEEILVDILGQIYPNYKMRVKRDMKLAEELCKKLLDKKCLIVLDDIWDTESLHYLQNLFPDVKGKLLVTTRLLESTRYGESDQVINMRLLNEEESWSLLCKKIFCENSCPPELQEAGKRISKKCDGLPLLILTVGDLLSKAERTPDYWNEVAQEEHSLFVNAHNKISEALFPSYNNLPQFVKACFLYMGAFPQNCEIPTKKLIKLCVAEGFLEPDSPDPSLTIEDFSLECLWTLYIRSFVMACEISSKKNIVKSYRLHSIYWHLSNSEAARARFFYVLNRYADIKGVKSQPRLCIRNNILLGIKDVHNSMETASIARSVLCVGPPHQYPVPVFKDIRLLRVMVALNIRLYEFPIEVEKLIQLRYIALTCNGKLPSFISKLWKLEYLILREHLSIKSLGHSLYLPVEIWNMKKLKHLQIMGSNLPNPTCGSLLPNLVTLLDVSAHSCTKEILEGIPNLKKLGIRIELAPDDGGDPFRGLSYISHLSRLESLKCVVVNPEFNSEVVNPPAPLLMFPSSLIKLSLSGLGYPWEYMSIIGSLPKLEVLKLRCYAFRGPSWQAEHNDFKKLKFLLIEDTDLMHWKAKLLSFPKIKHLIFKDCYKLEKLPDSLLGTAEKIDVVDCNPSVMTWTKQIESKYPFKYVKTKSGSLSEISVHSSWDAGNLKL